MAPRVSRGVVNEERFFTSRARRKRLGLRVTRKKKERFFAAPVCRRAGSE